MFFHDGGHRGSGCPHFTLGVAFFGFHVVCDEEIVQHEEIGVVF